MSNKFRTIPEESQASQRAKQMGLVYKGFGRWADPQTGKVTHKTEDGQLVPVGQEPDPTSQKAQGMRDNPQRPRPDQPSWLKGEPRPADLEAPKRGDDEPEDDYYDRAAGQAASQDRAEKGLDADPPGSAQEPEYDAPQEQPPKDLSLARAYGIDAVNPQEYIQKLQKHIDMPKVYQNALQKMASDIGNKGLIRDKAVKALDRMASDDKIMSKYVQQEKERQATSADPEQRDELERLKNIQQDIIKRGKKALANNDDQEAERLAQIGQKVVDKIKSLKGSNVDDQEPELKQDDERRRDIISQARRALQQGDKKGARELMKKLPPSQ